MTDSVSDTYDSAHDPLCDKWYEYTRPLQFDPDECGICDLTRMVREDERDNARSSVAEIHAIELWDGVKTAWWIVKADALTALRALQEKP